MNEVLNKVQELVALLEEKNKVTAVLNKQLTEQKKNNETLNEQAIAKLKHASAMERVYKKYEDFDKAVKQFNAEKVDNNARVEAAKLQEANDLRMLKRIEEENVKLDARKIVLTKQALALKEKEANFNKKKEDLKAMISGQAIKDILK